MDGVQVAQQDALRIASRRAGSMTADDDALLDRASHSIRLRGAELPCDTTASLNHTAECVTAKTSTDITDDRVEV